MGSIVRDFRVDAELDTAWKAVADLGAVNKLISSLGEVTVEGERRTCALGDIGTLEELIVAVDEGHYRVAYSIRHAPIPFTHHHASMQVLRGDDHTRFLWITDFKPEEVRPTLEGLIDQAVESIRAALKR